jgi:RHH-type proline utilization regulon transcriptional repressor/proline dehydrogenase/delta 1-pyrroline-5-carboxylate dehydrogenase
VRTRRDRFAATAEAIRAKGYALTGGIHTRVAATRDRVAEALDVGSFYVNRGLTGAVPGMHPFGGHGLSGTGPKAGGGRYVERFAREQVIIENTAAIGADPALNDTDPC